MPQRAPFLRRHPDKWRISSSSPAAAGGLDRSQVAGLSMTGPDVAIRRLKDVEDNPFVAEQRPSREKRMRQRA